MTRVFFPLALVVGTLFPTAAQAAMYDPSAAAPMVTIVMSRSEISAADSMLGTCTQDNTNIAQLPWVLRWMSVNSPRVHLTGSIETAKTKDSATWCAHYGETIAPSWSHLQSFGSLYGMHFISHSADYPQNWTTVPPTWSGGLASWQNYETCGSRDAITQHGLFGADGQFNWPDQKTDPTVMINDVNQCFYTNRSYHGNGVNTLASVEGNQDIATTRQLEGGYCNVTSLPCSSVLAYRYTVPHSVINQINGLLPGQELNLQGYVLVANSNPDVTTGVNQYTTNKDQWDCANPNPAYHWTNDVERYCWVDFQRIIMAIQNDPNVVITDPEVVAQTWGMTPPIR